MTTLFITFWSIVGSGATYYWSAKYKQSPVLTSAASSLLAALTVYAFQSLIGESFAKTLSLAFFGGSFVGMSAPSVIKNMKNVLIGGGIFGILFVATQPLFTGYGGGLGFRATLSVFITLGIQGLMEKASGRLKSIG